MRTTRSLLAPRIRYTAKPPCSSLIVRARNTPAESDVMMTAPRTGSFVTLSFSAPPTRCACAGDVATTSAATRSATVALRAPTSEGAHAVNQPVDFFLTCVATTSDAHETVRHETQSLDDRRRVEIAVRDEHAAFGKRDGNVIGRESAQRERQ